MVLFNEFLCYRLAILLDISMPKSGICLIDSDTVIYNNCGITEKQYGYGFYSTYLNKSTTLVESIIPMINNIEVFYKILLFDHIIFNPDRNPGNLLVQYYQNNISLYVIDHSHVFINQAIWDANCLKQAIEEKDYFSTRVLEENDYLYSMFFRNMPMNINKLSSLTIDFQNKITDKNIQRFISDIPSEWLPSQKDVDALIHYILYRVEHLDDINITIMKYLSK